MNILDHIGVPVGDVARSKAFHSAALAPLGAGIVMEAAGGEGFGREGKPSFWIVQGRPPGGVMSPSRRRTAPRSTPSIGRR